MQPGVDAQDVVDGGVDVGGGDGGGDQGAGGVEEDVAFDAVDLLRDLADGGRDRALFIESRDLNDKLHAVKVSVIMPVERLGGDAERAIESVLAQRTTFPFELIVVSAAPVSKAGVCR